MFFALCHCDKLLFCFLHRITATNRFFISCIESQKQTKFAYLAKKKLCSLFSIFLGFLEFNLEFFGTLMHFCALFATFCCSDSVRQTIWKTIFNFFVICDKGTTKKTKSNILSYLNFTTPIKLLWCTLLMFFLFFSSYFIYSVLVT